MVKTNTPEEIDFFRALTAGDVDRVKRVVAENGELLNAFSYENFGATPLTHVCWSNQIKMVELLLDLGADPNRRSDWHMGAWSPLHCATTNRNGELVDYLLSRGATLDVHTAAGRGWVDEVARLLDRNPERVTERGGDGCHPLHFADSQEVAQLLLERGAEIDARCIDHFSTPVQYLCIVRPSVARYLFSRGATPDIFSAILAEANDLAEEMLKNDSSLLSARINQVYFPPSAEHDVHNILTFRVGQDATPLHAAAREDREEGVKLLVRHGMSPNVRGGYDQSTPLHFAAWNDSLQSAMALVECGADLNARSGHLHNNTPAGWAIVGGSAKVFEYLMEQGAEKMSWFIDDARDACDGRFDQVRSVPKEQRARIFSHLNSAQ